MKTAKLPQVGDKVWAFSTEHRREIKVQVSKVFANTFQGIDSEKNTVTKLSKWRPATSGETVEPSQVKEEAPIKSIRTTLTNIPLDQIKVERRFQQRSIWYNAFDDDGEPYLDNNTIERYRELLLKDDDGNPKDPPPLLVYRLADGDYLVDGFHRYAAMQAEGRELAPCNLVEGATESEALIESCTINVKNGLGVTKNDICRSLWRIFSVREALPEDDPRRKWSDRHIARMFGCSNSTVSLIHRRFLLDKAFKQSGLAENDRVKCINPESEFLGIVGRIARIDPEKGFWVYPDTGQNNNAGQNINCGITLLPSEVESTDEYFFPVGQRVVINDPASIHNGLYGAVKSSGKLIEIDFEPGQQDKNGLDVVSTSISICGEFVSPTQVKPKQKLTTNSNQSPQSNNFERTSGTSTHLLTSKDLETASDDQLNDLFRKLSMELERRLDTSIQTQLSDLLDAVWDEISDFDQRKKEQFLILLIDKSFSY